VTGTLTVKTAVGKKVLELDYDKVVAGRKQGAASDGNSGEEGEGAMTQERLEREYFGGFDLDHDGELDR
jgi:hypothetical protein